ncbi:beta strand repeat-containing protein [Spirosoma lituiforme]
MMSYLTSHIRAGSTLVALLFLCLLLPGHVQAQFPTLPAVPTSCSYTTAPATVSLTASAASSGFSTAYLLVDMTSGIIVKANTSAPVFTAVPAGIYYAVAAHYTGGLNNASAGNLISQVYSSNQCLSYGTPLALKVCNATSTCDFQSAPASVTFTASNVPSSVNTTYVLVDESTNTIVKTSNTASFSAVAVGDYAITSVHYSGSLTALAAGNRLYDVVNNAANCRNVSQALRIRVCNSPIVITSPAAGATVASLNPPVSGTTTPGSSVTVTGGPGSTGGPCITTANASGNWSCTSLTFTAGPASVTATNGVTSAVSNFTAATPTTLTVNPPVPGPVTQPIAGTTTPGNLVTITGPNNVTLCSTTASSSGTFSCLITVPTGPTSVTVTTTGPGGTTSVPLTVTAVAPPTVAINSPSGVQTSTSPTVSGTATPGSVVSIMGPGNATLCSTTATAGGSYSCVVNVTTGPVTLTATATNPGGTASTTTSFTAVSPPSLTVSPNNTVASTTPTISGTATPGSQIAITGPGNATLCTTTASVSGTFACMLTTPLPTGPTTLTVSATGLGGTTTRPATLTLVDPTPSISTQPLGGQTACVGSIATLSVSASAAVGNLVYQWQSASSSTGPFSSITGATSATYNAPTTNAGTIYYRVLVSNTESGTVTSSTAVVSTVGSPSITVQPTATQTVCAGSPASLSVTASGGTGTLTYQWQSASSPTGTFTPINSATLTSYNVPTATAATTYYRVLVSSAGSGCGTVTSSVANVIVNAQPTIGGVSPVNPSTCSTNTGAITLSGLVPSATHTISYSKNGGSVTTATLVADASGNVVLNGLGAGTYTGITANVGSCVSAPYAATVTLTDPVPAALAANQITAYNTTSCGTSTGRIEITGLSANTGGLVVSYSRNGSPVTVTLSTDASGKATISSLSAGSYTAFTVQTGSCTTAPFAGPVTIADPGLTALSGSNISSTSPTSCGAANGTITLSGLPANTALTISYQKGGSPMTASVTTSSAGQATLSGQGAGVYTQITYSVGACTSAPFSGSVTIADPGVTPLTAANVSGKAPTFCGGTNGRIEITGLSSNQSITINYKKDGVAQSPVNGITDATGKVVIGSLSQANYTDITYTLGACTSAAYTGTINMQQPELSSSQVSGFNPAVCGANTGRIELTGLGSNQSLNINYVYNGSPLVVAVTSDATGKATITGLFSGTYTAMSYAQGTCTSTVYAGPLYLTNPAPTALSSSNVLGINPTQCGQTNGRIEITGLAGNISTTVTYKRNGVVQSTIVSADASGKATIPSLLAGTYSDFTYSQGSCTSAPYIGPVTLTDPTPTPLTQGNVATFNPTSCSATDGRIEITGLASNVSTTLTYAKNGVSSTAVVTSDNSGKATLTVGVGSYSNFSYLQGTCVSNPYAVTLTISVAGCGRLFVNAYLQGALVSNGGSLSTTGKPLMRDNLRAGGYLPLSDPYRTAAYSGLFPQVNNAENQSIAASLTAVTGDKAIVDWVFIELRNKTNPAAVSYTRSGLLLRDGTVIDSDGQPGLAFSGATADNYYVAIRHRNHLGTMTQQLVSYAGTGAATTVDFITMTDAQIWNASGYDGIERSTVTASSQTVRALWAGNTVGNNKVKYSGSGSGLPVILNNIVNYPGGSGAFNFTNAYGYLNGDVNMDGRALYVGSGNDGAVILGNVIAYPLNSAGVYNYDLMLQQLP